METYKAYFREFKKERVITLTFGIVSKVEEHEGTVTAYMYDPGEPDGRKYKFHVSKPGRPFGSRRKVRAVNGTLIPTITLEKDDFEVRPGSVVLFERPHEESSAFPVVSWNSYQEAQKLLSRTSVDVEVIPPHKHDHCWPPAPPFPGTSGTNT